MTTIADLREGDVGFGPIGGFVPGMLPVGLGQLWLSMTDREAFKHWREWRTVRHVFMVTDEKLEHSSAFIGQAMPSGFERIPLDPAKHWTSQHVYVRPPYSFALDQARRAAQHARRMAECRVPYAFEDYAAIAAKRAGIPVPHLDAFISRVDARGYPERAICSQAVDACLTLAGYQVFDDGRLPQNVTPFELFIQLIKTPGASLIWPDGSTLGARRWWEVNGS